MAGSHCKCQLVKESTTALQIRGGKPNGLCDYINGLEGALPNLCDRLLTASALKGQGETLAGPQGVIAGSVPLTGGISTRRARLTL
jgi:galactokinase